MTLLTLTAIAKNMNTRATLTFILEWDEDELELVDPKETLLEILADQPDKDLYDLITVETI